MAVFSDMKVGEGAEEGQRFQLFDEAEGSEQTNSFLFEFEK